MPYVAHSGVPARCGPIEQLAGYGGPNASLQRLAGCATCSGATVVIVPPRGGAASSARPVPDATARRLRWASTAGDTIGADSGRGFGQSCGKKSIGRLVAFRRTMARIQIGGAGGAPANNVIRSLRSARSDDYLIGTSCVPSDLLIADVDERHVIPEALSADYETALMALLSSRRPDLLHVQHDFEVRAVSRLREKIVSLGTAVFLPAAETIETCVDKYLSYTVWQANGVYVPETILISNEADLTDAFSTFPAPIWFRMRTGGGGRGAIATADPEFARLWIERLDGWGEFTAAMMLTPASVTWSSIWNNGELVVAQSRRRQGWAMGSRAPSGVTGVTGIGETFSDVTVDVIAENAIYAIDGSPHGIFSVDLTLDETGTPCPTEINIGRFFTTIHFFTAAGLNMPALYRDIALGEYESLPSRLINPLPDGLLWIRGMDCQPLLTTVDHLQELEKSR